MLQTTHYSALRKRALCTKFYHNRHDPSLLDLPLRSVLLRYVFNVGWCNHTVCLDALVSEFCSMFGNYAEKSTSSTGDRHRDIFLMRLTAVVLLIVLFHLLRSHTLIIPSRVPDVVGFSSDAGQIAMRRYGAR